MIEKGTLTLILGIVLVLMAAPAQAAPLIYDFGVTATSGPLTGTHADGTFTFDSGIIPSGGGFVDQTNLLTDLSFTWDGITYDENTANTGTLRFDALGNLTRALFGNSCDAGSCAVINGSEEWFFDSTFSFLYSVAGGNEIGGATITLQPAAVPEPSTVFLIIAGLAGVGLLRRRI